MKCLYCGKQINENAKPEEKEHCWHGKCIKNFFGIAHMPLLDITEEQIEKLANDTVNKGMTIPGVQKKLSLHLSNEKEARLTIVNYPTGYILKPQTEEYDSLPEFEDLAMCLAEIAGIQTVPHALIKINGRYAYITKRIDRNMHEDYMEMYAMEDFCQLSNRLTQDKYRGSYEGCGRVINKYSIQPGLDMSELFMRVVFSFIIGNSDMHLKNFSLIETEPKNRKFHLSMAYDMLPVNIIVPMDEEQLALTMNGKKRNIRKKDFMVFAKTCGIEEKAALKMMKKLCDLKDKYLQQCDQSYLSEELKEKTKNLIIERIDVML